LVQPSTAVDFILISNLFKRQSTALTFPTVAGQSDAIEGTLTQQPCSTESQQGRTKLYVLEMQDARRVVFSSRIHLVADPTGCQALKNLKALNPNTRRVHLR
jgi:hypothetical protein